MRLSSGILENCCHLKASPTFVLELNQIYKVQHQKMSPNTIMTYCSQVRRISKGDSRPACIVLTPEKSASKKDIETLSKRIECMFTGSNDVLDIQGEFRV